MKLQHLRFFVCAAEAMSFSRAADQCCVTQPTLSNAIAQLESELGGRLFNRTTRKVSLTPFGAHLLPDAQAMLMSEQELQRRAESYINPDLQILRIGQSPLVDARLISTVLDPFRRQHAATELFFKECYLDDLDKRLDAETIDFGIRPVLDLRLPNVNHERAPLYCDKLYFLPNEHSDLALNQGARLDIIESETFVLTPDGCGLAGITEQLFAHYQVQLKRYQGQALSYQVLQDWTDLGVGAAILPLGKITAEHRKRARPLMCPRGSLIDVQFEAVWKRGRIAPGVFAHLTSHFRDVAAAVACGTQFVN